VLDEVSEHNINGSAPLKKFKTIKSPTVCFTVRIIRGKLPYSNRIFSLMFFLYLRLYFSTYAIAVQRHNWTILC